MSVVLRESWPALMALTLLVGIWEAAVRAFDIPTVVLPAPTQIFEILMRRPELFFRNSLVTLKEIGIGLGASVAFGVPLGIAAAKSRWFARSLYPVIVGTQSVPKLALAPLFVVWFGFGAFPKALIAFLIAFFPIMVNTAVGITGIDPDLKTLSRALGLSRLEHFIKIELPGATPMIFAGLKLAAPFAVIGAVVGEFIGAEAGLGKLTLTASTTLNTPLLFASLILLAGIGLACYGLALLIEALVAPWHVEDRDRLVRTGL